MVDIDTAMKGELVIFDLDETLTRRDTYIPYLLKALGKRPTRLVRCFPLPFYSLWFLLGFRDNRWLKEKFLSAVLKGWAIEELQSLNRDFVARLLENGMNTTVTERLERHQDRGHRLVLLSASLDCYVNDIGRALGFSDVIATRVEVTEGRLTGRLAGPNLKGVEKVRAMEDRLDGERDSYRITAYADDVSDRHLLGWSDQGFWVKRSPELERLAMPHRIDFL